jgi:hypothetical protein
MEIKTKMLPMYMNHSSRSLATLHILNVTCKRGYKYTIDKDNKITRKSSDNIWPWLVYHYHFYKTAQTNINHSKNKQRKNGQYEIRSFFSKSQCKGH